MARPKRNNADYFSHDAGMRNDPKVKALRNKYGCTGYSVWCMMLEVLTESDFFTRSIDEIEIEILSADFGIEADLFSEILQYMLRLRLLQTGNNCEFLSQKLTDRLQPVIDKRSNSRKRVVSVTESTQSKVKESKVKKSKEDKDTAPSPKDVEIAQVAKKLLDYLNKRLSRNFQSTDDLVKRLKEGSKEKDIADVIDLKIKEWGDDEKMKTYLVPSTLFGKGNLKKYIEEKPDNECKQAEDARQRKLRMT